MFVATAGGHTAAAEALLKCKADVNQATKKGTTPLEMATIRGHTTIANLLKQHHAFENPQTLFSFSGLGVV